MIKAEFLNPKSGTQRSLSFDFGTTIYYQLFWFVFFIVFFIVLGQRSGTDATYDLKNYHFYNGFSVFHDRSRDIFPAQLQSSFFKGLDGLYYLLFTNLNDQPKLLNSILSLPYGISAFAIFQIGRNSVERFWFRDPLCAIASIFGLCGAAGLATLATTMSDIVPATPLLVALSLWIYWESRQANTIQKLLIVGALAGASVALKLSMAAPFVGFCAAIALRYFFGEKRALQQALAFALMGFGTIALIDGPWLLSNYQHYGNPIFPFENNIFKSPLAAAETWTDNRFFPKNWRMGLFFPYFWGTHTSQDAIELLMRDPRILIGWVAIFLIVVNDRIYFELRRSSLRPSVICALCLACFFAVGYILWEMEWSIYRYLAAEESLTGVLALMAVSIWVQNRRWRAPLIWAILTPTFLLSAQNTRLPDWQRLRHTKHVIDVQMPPIADDSIVLFLEDAPYSYLVPYMPQNVTVIGANNNLIKAKDDTPLTRKIRTLLANAPSQIWGLDQMDSPSNAGDKVLESYHLRRTNDCAVIKSNIEDTKNWRFCRLDK